LGETILIKNILKATFKEKHMLKKNVCRLLGFWEDMRAKLLVDE